MQHKPVLIIAACICASGSRVGATPALEISPKRVLVDTPPTIRASGLDPNERVTIRAELVDGADEAWSSQAEFAADSAGVIDVSKQSPLAGSYKIVSAAGLIWSMLPASKNIAGYLPPKVAPQVIHFRLIRNGEILASSDLEQTWIAEDVSRLKLEGALHGVLLEPSGTGPRAGILVLGGSEGGVPLRTAAWLASHGYAALALAYFRYEDLPPKLEAIPLEYFGRAVSWMMNRPEILKDRIAVLGTSRGGELALQLGSIFAEIKAVVAYVPANTRHPACCGDTTVPYAWTLQGRPLPYLPLRRMRDPLAVQAAAIGVENTNGPILMISGQDDAVWDSSMMADAVIGRLKSAHFQYSFEHLRYQHAGHRAGHAPIVPAWHGHARHPVSGREVHYGGTAEGDAKSSLDATPKVLEFLRKNLSERAP